MKQRIIETTVEMLEKYGTQFTVNTLAEELGASKKTIYKYFESKEELAENVFNYICCNAEKNQDTISASDLTKREKLIKLMLEYIKILQISSNTLYGHYRLSDALYKKYVVVAENNWNKIASVFLLQDTDNYKFIIDGLTKNVYSKRDHTAIYQKCLQLIFNGMVEDLCIKY